MKNKQQLIKDLKNLGIIVLLLIFHFGSYFFSKNFVNNPTILNNNIEDQIPFVPVFVLSYMSWYVLLLVVPFILSRKSKKDFKVYCVCQIICATITFFIFIFLPTAVKVPQVDGNDIFSSLCKLIYSNDTQQNGLAQTGYTITANCLPSGHTILSLLFIYSCVACKNVSKKTTIIVSIFSVLVILSTIFIKQHVIIDLVTGFVLITVVYIIVAYIFNKKEKK